MRTVVWFGFVLGALSAAGKVIITKQGQKATIECGVNTYSFNWHHGNDLIFDMGGKFLRKGTGDIVARSTVRNANLVVDMVKQEDAGKFTCRADRRSYEHTLLVVSVWASTSDDIHPGSNVTLQCQVKGLNPDSTVQWKRPDGRQQTGSQIVELKPVALSDAGTWNCMFSHDGIMYNESLVVKVKEPAPPTPAPVPSQNSKDIRATNLPSDGDLLLGLSWWMWVIIGVGYLVMVLLTVFVICLCKKIKRRKRKLQKMKNCRLPLTPKQYCQCNCPTAAATPQQRRKRKKPSVLPLQTLQME